MDVEQVVYTYLDKYGLFEKNIALALSGGPDSMALYHVLKKMKKPDLVIHINHNMRKESVEEAKILQQQLQDDQIPFVIHTIEDFDFTKGNIEDRLREIRQKLYFLSMGKEKIHHLLVGHQKNDMEEVILKRILEGSSLFKLSKFLIPNQIGDYFIHKPLYQIEKTALIDYLVQHKKGYFIDHTNFDLKYLRSRMRMEIFPLLQQSFGKNIDGKFFDLACNVQEMTTYIYKQCLPYLSSIIQGPLGLFLPRQNMDRLEWKFVLTKIIEENQESITSSDMTTLLQLIEERKANKQVILRNHILYVEKAGVFFVKKKHFVVESLITEFDQKIKFDLIKLWKGDATYFQMNEKEHLPYFIRKMVQFESHREKSCLLLKSTD
jgi:tRNA(Ile)-lysidine synthase